MERNAQTYVAMLEDLDTEVGRLLEVLDKLEIADNTVVVFVSDNGGLSDAANMGPLSGAKSTTLEGGIRVPLIIRWPGRIKPNTVSNQVSATFDLTCSFLGIAKTDTPAKRLDGYDIIGHVAEQRGDFPRTLHWRGRRGDRTWWAVRDRDLKYVRKTESGQTDQWLFDLSSDVGEKKDLYETRVSEANRLKKMLSDWEAEVKPMR